MYKSIVVPVDLAHVADLNKALKTAGDLAKHYGASVCYVGVTAATPSSVAHNPAEYEQKLAAFAADQASTYGHTATSKAVVSHDPAVDLEDGVLGAVTETGADLIVVASHVPNLADHLWPAHGGTIARRADVSVMIVR